MNTRLRLVDPSVRVLLVTILGAVLGAGAVVWTRTELVRLQYELTDLHQLEAGLRGDVEKLRVEVAALSTPERIERRARAQGLRYPRPDEVLSLSSRRASDPAAHSEVHRLARVAPPGAER